MTKKVVLSEPIHEEGMNIIRENAELVIASDPGEETLIEAVKDADGLIVRSTPVTPAIIKAGRNLKVIGRHGMGLDNIDLDTAESCGVVVVNTPDANVLSVAEHVVSVMLHMSKRLNKVDNALRAGEFDMPGSLPGLVNKLGYSAVELYGKTLGLVGAGKIARRTAEICMKGFNMKVIAYDAYMEDRDIREEGIEPCKKLEEVFEEGDFISVHVPLTTETHGFIGEEKINRMKSSAFLINTARGGVIDESALYKALKNRVIAGAATDVFEEEPPGRDYPLFELDNIVVTPHMAAMTDGALIRMARDVAYGVVSVLNGERPEHLVNPNVWEKMKL